MYTHGTRKIPLKSRQFLLRFQIIFYLCIRAHLQTMLWKAADHHAPAGESMYIIDFDWNIRNGILVDAVADRDTAPPQLSHVINCQCKAVGKKSITEACGCLGEYVSSTKSCNFNGEYSCCNPHTTLGVRSPQMTRMLILIKLGRKNS